MPLSPALWSHKIPLLLLLVLFSQSPSKLLPPQLSESQQQAASPLPRARVRADNLNVLTKLFKKLPPHKLVSPAQRCHKQFGTPANPHWVSQGWQPPPLLSYGWVRVLNSHWSPSPDGKLSHHSTPAPTPGSLSTQSQSTLSPTRSSLPWPLSCRLRIG